LSTGLQNIKTKIPNSWLEWNSVFTAHVKGINIQKRGKWLTCKSAGGSECRRAWLSRYSAARTEKRHSLGAGTTTLPYTVVAEARPKLQPLFSF
jgi:hypothetical protein